VPARHGESLIEPIFCGREELGWNKVYADLSAPRMPPSQPVLHRQYIPAAGQWGRADVDDATTPPLGHAQVIVLSHANAQAQPLWPRPRSEDMPAQHHIVQASCDLPLGPSVEAGA
jgi:hypothetical protein